ncbi:DoxX family protein [Roseateles sp. NT4]|uniref:DoxX family protein n=1 Tax=Roseateles sp. NT4 TaxID=3453715 RepID=UPI003EE9C575
MSDFRSRFPIAPLTLLRLTVALFVALHGWVRFVHGDALGFGVYVEQHGVPLGRWLGPAVTAYEMLASIVLASGRFVFPLSLGFAAIYMVGIPVYHWPNGWFSSGSDDGCEYPTLMIICFLCLAWQHAPGALRARWPALFAA